MSTIRTGVLWLEVIEMEKKKMKTIDIVYIGLSAAVIAVCSWISVQIGAIPVTLQTMAVCLVAGLFGAKKGTMSVGVYILLGAIGIPVFSHFKGGIGVLLGATGGYIIGFLFTALIVGWISDKTDAKLIPLLFASTGGVLVCYAFGSLWFALIFLHNGAPKSFAEIMSMCVLPFLPFDAIKIVVAGILTNRLKKYIQS